ncbi:unnamed protein product [Calypogeia fissa]
MMGSNGRRITIRRSQRDLCDNLILGFIGVASLLCAVFLLHLSSSILAQSAVGPTFHLHHHSTLNVDLEVVSHQSSMSQRNALNHVSDGMYRDPADDLEMIIQTTTSDNAVSNIEEGKSKDDNALQLGGKSERKIVSRVAFGSCTSRKPIKQPIWREGIIPSNIDAWIWAGDIAYMDWPDINCKENPDDVQCNCTRTWLHNNRQTCFSGDIEHAKKKLEIQLQNPDYKEFLQYMCPDSRSNPISAWGDLALCNKPIVGTWDDHDYNWQDGDKRLPTKEEQKKLFLNAFGVPSDSLRRAKERGIYWKHTLNEGIDGKEIDVLLLDERFHRDSKPCETRREFCEKVSLPDPKKYKHEWCKDFLGVGEDGRGACCKKDELIWGGWCKVDKNRDDDLWEAACDPKSKMYGSLDLAVDKETGNPVRKSTGSSLSYDDGVLCEVLGQEQRSWLQDELYLSKAPLKLIVSGSPVFNNPQDFVCASAIKKRPAVSCSCYDDYDCFRPAQINLLHNLANARGCAVVLTGDFHFSDIKVLQPGKQFYSDAYASEDLPHPIFQIMASGLTEDTGQKGSCEGYRVDKNGMRPDGECGFVSGPAFGMIEVDWDSPQPIAKLQVRDDQGIVRLESIMRLDTCTLL